MELLAEIFAQSALIGLGFLILFILLIWFFIKSAVKAGTKQAIHECYNEIFRADEIKAEQERKFKEEMDSWN